VFVPDKPLQPSLLLAVKANSLTKRGVPERLTRVGWPHLQILQTRLKRLGRDKHFSLFGPFVKTGLHYGDYRSKLVHFESEKK
jgi:hypothetical protein